MPNLSSAVQIPSLVWWVNIGINLGIAAYHLVLFYVTRKNTYLYFSITLTSLTALFSDAQGLLPLTIWTGRHWHIMFSNSVISFGYTQFSVVTLFSLYISLQLTRHLNLEKQHRLQAQQKALERLHKLQELYNSSTEGLFSMRPDGYIIACNPAFAQILALPHPFQSHQKTPCFFPGFLAHEQPWQDIQQRLKQHRRISNYELAIRVPGSVSVRWVLLSGQWHDEAGQQRIEGSFIDITLRKQYEYQLQYLSEHDTLTQLLNRRCFEKNLQQALQCTWIRDSIKHTLLYLDLDQFKVINDTCGHPAGDECLRQITVILKKHIRVDEIAARLGGDEFGLLLKNRTETEALEVSENIRTDLERYHFVWQGHYFRTTVSIGVVVLTTQTKTIENVLSLADMACYAAKEAGRNRIMSSSHSTLATHKQLNQMETAANLTHALQENRLLLYRQSILALHSNTEAKLQHYEILARLPYEGRILQPGNFLPAAQRYNLLIPLDRWVIKQSCAWLATQTRIKLTLNMSLLSLMGSDLVCFIKALLTEYRLSSDNLCFDISELTTTHNQQHLLRNLHQLADLGIQLALDDYGSGAASFNTMKELPIHYIKIEGRYIRNLLKDPLNYAMVRTVADIAHTLGKAVVAEALEDATTLEALRDLKIDYAQGFYFDKPTPLPVISGFTQFASRST